MKNKPNPDDRRDNAKKIKQTIESTKRNMEAAEEMIARTSSSQTKKDLKAKNKRRAQAIPAMEQEMKQEKAYQKKKKK